MPRQETAKFLHVFYAGCNQETCWNILFSDGFDKFYLERNHVGTTVPLEVTPTLQELDKETGENRVLQHKRLVKIYPNVGILGVIVNIAKKWYYGGTNEEINYTTTQIKSFQLREDGYDEREVCMPTVPYYEMSFENDVYKVEFLKSPGVIRLARATEEQVGEYFKTLEKQATEEDDETAKQILENFDSTKVMALYTIIQVTTDFPMLLVGAHSGFMGILNSQTEMVFRQMVDSVYPYFLNPFGGGTGSSGSDSSGSSGSSDGSSDSSNNNTSVE